MVREVQKWRCLICGKNSGLEPVRFEFNKDANIENIIFLCNKDAKKHREQYSSI